jgi:hypothetical protein
MSLNKIIVKEKKEISNIDKIKKDINKYSFILLDHTIKYLDEIRLNYIKDKQALLIIDEKIKSIIKKKKKDKIKLDNQEIRCTCKLIYKYKNKYIHFKSDEHKNLMSKIITPDHPLQKERDEKDKIKIKKDIDLYNIIM